MPEELFKSALVSVLFVVVPPPKVSTQLMGQLPGERVNPSFANKMVSVDYAGPVFIKAGSKQKPISQKAYIAIFVCLQTKSCHVQLVSDLTAEAFVTALRRFVARRGNLVILE